MAEKLRVAAVQLDARIGDVPANIAACRELAQAAADDGARWIILPEFFTTGMAFDQAVANGVTAADGPGLELLVELARSHGATTGGSFICRDDDGHTRNAFMLVAPDGRLIGRHDKDLPTMWENCFYVGGDDPGVFTGATDEGVDVGVAMCWELIRRQTAERLAGKIDIVVGGSCWWSIPSWPPRALTARMERKNHLNAVAAAGIFAPLVGAPVVHAAHCGAISCDTPWVPFLPYRGHAEGGAAIFDANGRTLALRTREEGPGHVIADVELARRPTSSALPQRYWLPRRGAVPTLAWNYQRIHGRRWYASNVGPGSASGNDKER